MKKVTSKIIVPHSEDCFAKGGKHEWSGIPDKKNPYYFAGFNAKQCKRGNSHIWIRIICNDPKCPAIKAVNSNVLREA